MSRNHFLSEMGFSNGVVIVVNTSAHAAHQMISIQKALPVSTAELASLILMPHHSSLWLATPDCQQ